ncbi:methyltransferase domain-containing protein [bacterium]|nr:methyltransferase domain-containing protein [bacterium]
MQAKQHLDRVYQAQSPQELRQAYGEWAAAYDQDLVEGMGWDKPVRVGQALLPFLPPPSAQPAILDVGAGTGLVGQFLFDHGYQNLSAGDFCPAMLAQAGQRKVYRQLLEMDLNLPLDLPEGHFEAITAVGIFTEGHLGPACLQELCRVLKRGGHLAFSLRDDLQPLYAAHQAALPCDLCLRQAFSDGLESRPWSAWIYRLR